MDTKCAARLARLSGCSMSNPSRDFTVARAWATAGGGGTQHVGPEAGRAKPIDTPVAPALRPHAFPRGLSRRLV